MFTVQVSLPVLPFSFVDVSVGSSADLAALELKLVLHLLSTTHPSSRIKVKQDQTVSRLYKDKQGQVKKGHGQSWSNRVKVKQGETGSRLNKVKRGQG